MKPSGSAASAGDAKQKLQQAFAETIRHLRAHHPDKPSQAELAERAGMERTYLGDLERGERNLTLWNLWRIAQALGVRPSRLISAIDKRYQRLAGGALSPPETAAELYLKHLRHFMDEAPTMKWFEDVNRQNNYVNRHLLEFLGRRAEDQAGEKWKEIIHPDDLARVDRERLKAFRSRHPYVSQYRVRRADGTYVWIVQQATPQSTPKGEFVGFMGSVIEVPQKPEPHRRSG